jgi:Dolichyl-phosphate-mannose-protein mannosyltransferase
MTPSEQGDSYSVLTVHHERLIVIGLVALFVMMALGYSAGPVFEGPDESAHYLFVRDIFVVGLTPHFAPAPVTDIYAYSRYEYDQPPLYYLAAGTLKLLLPDPDFIKTLNFRNFFDQLHEDRSSTEIFGRTGNYSLNRWLHSRVEQFPYTQSGTALAVHVLRLFSIVLATVSVLIGYALFRILWPARPDRRLLALGIVAFWPTLEYDSGLVNNDVMIGLMSALSLWLLLRQMRDGPTWKSAAVLGAALGLALLSKPSGIVLAAPVGLAVVMNWKRWWRYALLTLVIAIGVGGWWYLRKAILYHDPTGLSSLALNPIAPGALNTNLIISRIAVIFTRFWARFGRGVLIAPPLPIDILFDVLTLIGVSGAVLGLARLARKQGWSMFRPLRMQQGLVLGVYGVVLVVAVIVRGFQTWGGNHGRYLLPAAASWAALMAYGLDAWTPPRLRFRIAFSVPALMATIAMLCLFGSFFPAYRPLSGPTEIEVPRHITYGDVLELTGVQKQVVSAHPGERITLTLYWQALQQTDQNLFFVLRTDPDLLAVSNYPATGNLLSTEWVKGQTWTERVLVIIPPDAQPGSYALQALVIRADANPRYNLPGFNLDSARVHNPVIMRLVVQ